MTDLIAFTKVRLPYGWLGNMSPYTVVNLRHNQVFPTAEHHFQCQRLPENHPVIAKVLKLPSPMAAKILVRQHEKDFIVQMCSAEDLGNMRRTLRLKFEQHDTLRDALLATGDAYILEDVTSRQGEGSAMFWGGVPVNDSSSNVPWVGKNWLGKLLMERRGILRTDGSLNG